MFAFFVTGSSGLQVVVGITEPLWLLLQSSAAPFFVTHPPEPLITTRVSLGLLGKVPNLDFGTTRTISESLRLQLGTYGSRNSMK